MHEINKRQLIEGLRLTKLQWFKSMQRDDLPEKVNEYFQKYLTMLKVIADEYERDAIREDNKHTN